MKKVVILSLLVFLCMAYAQATTSSATPFIYAHYMHCFVLGGMPSGTQVRTGVDDPTNWPALERDYRPWWSAALAPLGLPNIPSAVQQDLDMARDAGLDAVALLIGNNHLPNSAYAPGMNLLAQTAATHQVKIIPDLWPAVLTYDQWVTFGQQVKTFMDAHPGAFYTYQGKPVISLGNAMGYGRGYSNFQEWANVQGFFTAWGGASTCYKIVNVPSDPSNLAETAWGTAADAFGLWATSLGWGDRQDTVLNQWTSTYGKPLFWPAGPSYYCLRQGNESMTEMLGVSRYCDQWRRAIAGQTGVEVQTWNDFSEDHGITDTNYCGRALIDLTRYFADWLHQGTPPTITRDKVFLFHHRQLTTATLTQNTLFSSNISWHMTPTTDYLEVVSLLQTPGTLHVQVGTSSWNLDAPAGCHEWLIYVPCPRTNSNPNNQAYTRPTGSYPTTDSNRTVTVATAIPAGTPAVTLSRYGEVMTTTVTSRLPLASTARFEDLCLIGTEATAPGAIQGLGFDEILNDPTKLASWAPTSGATMTPDTTTTWQGHTSLRYDITSSASAPGTYNYVLVDPSSTYVVYCIIKGQNLTFNTNTTKYLQFDLGPVTNFWTLKRSIPFTPFKDLNLSGTFDWTPVMLTVNTQAGDGAMRFRIGLNATTTGTFWIAGIRAYKVN
ncbi:MAG TPA: endo-1,3-alpha-glucanase family glycosylhydrolase [Armatimonadota bacterium]|jgi:hypothetical protein